jgi:hypothetical protein
MIHTFLMEIIWLPMVRGRRHRRTARTCTGDQNKFEVAKRVQFDSG